MKDYPLNETYEVRTFKEIIKKRLELYPDTPVFMQKFNKGGKFEKIYPEKYSNDINYLGTGFLSMMEKGSRVSILAETRYEWYVTYMATTNGTGCIVPLDKELHPDEIISMLDRAEVDMLVFSKSKKNIVDQIVGKVKSVRFYVCIDDLGEDSGYLSWNQIKNKGEELISRGNRAFIDAEIDPEEMTILLFTSGTTAKSKAVMLCQRNICSNIVAMFTFCKYSTSDIFLSVLPLHHTYECTCGFIGQVYRGTTIAICEGLRYIKANMNEVHPTCICMVPVMAQMFYRSIQKQLDSSKETRKKFNKAVKLSKFLLKFNIDIRRSLFKKIYESLGGNLRQIILGGAPIDPQILEFFQDIGLCAIQGYGLTECSPILALNRDVCYKNNSVGMPIPNFQVKILDPDEDGIGEFCAKGPSVFLGYYKDEEATKAAIDEDGWYHTGDLGYIDEDNFCVITGRKKNVIIAQNGKNVFPEEIEYLLSLEPIVCETIVSGVYDEHKNDIILVATIYPDMEVVKQELGDTPSKEEILQKLQLVVDKVNDDLVNYKRIKKVVYRDTEFDKNTSKKIKRY